MEIYYPIFIRDTDGWMSMLSSREEMATLEETDIKDKEYNIWDSKGVPLELFINGAGGVDIKILSETIQIKELIKAILEYAKLGRPNTLFVNSSHNDNVVELFKAVEAYVNSGRIGNKIRQLVQRLYQKWIL